MITTPEELALLLESEDMETEIVTVSGAIVIDTDDKVDFFNALQKLFTKYVYLDDNFHLNVEDEQYGVREI